MKLHIMLCLICLGSIDCEALTTVDKVQQEQTEKLMNQAERQVGMPNVRNFQQRKLLKTIYEITDRKDLVCYIYLQSKNTGKLVFIGKSLGFSVPASAQYTNPEYIASGGFAILSQPEPNALFMPSSSSGKWLMMINPNTNKARLVYFEPEIVISPFPLHLINE